MQSVRRWLVDIVAKNLKEPKGLGGLIVLNKLKTHNEILEHQAVETLGIQPNHRILEVGFGPGVGLAAALRRVKEGSGKVYGVDISSIVLSLTNQAFATEIKSGKLEIVQADVINLPYGKNFFDGIFHTNCYYFWPDIPLAIRELNRVLKPGGVMVTTLAPERLQKVTDEGYFKYASSWHMDDYTNALENGGFEDIINTVDDRKMTAKINIISASKKTQK